MVTVLLVLILAVLLFGATLVKSFLSGVFHGVFQFILFMTVGVLSIVVYDRFTYLVWGVLATVAVLVGGALIYIAVESRRQSAYKRLKDEQSQLASVVPRTHEVDSRLSQITLELVPFNERAARQRERQERREEAAAARIGVEKVGNEYRLKK
ncbi:MAG: hypothetical protein PHU46_16215 [Rhodocyclaceae bacterium]|nr:hypothetical protein [Rhodocyclaceae bacterium]